MSAKGPSISSPWSLTAKAGVPAGEPAGGDEATGVPDGALLRMCRTAPARGELCSAMFLLRPVFPHGEAKLCEPSSGGSQGPTVPGTLSGQGTAACCGSSRSHPHCQVFFIFNYSGWHRHTYCGAALSREAFLGPWGCGGAPPVHCGLCAVLEKPGKLGHL